MSSITITIDGPAGAGKGTLARHLAHIYDLDHLDTGLLYRAVALKMLEASEDLTDEQAATKMASSLKIDTLNNRRLREEMVGNAASQVAAFPGVRKALLTLQRDFANTFSEGRQGVILDGRDIGLAILPEALCKIYVTASPEVRARRRLKELHQKEINSIYEAVLEDIKVRDARDQTREASPLRPALDAFILDTSELSIGEAVEKASFFVDSKYPKAYKRTPSPLE